MTTEEKIEVMQAHIDGFAIEINNGTGWTILSKKNPIWDWRSCDYRILNSELIRKRVLDELNSTTTNEHYSEDWFKGFNFAVNRVKNMKW